MKNYFIFQYEDKVSSTGKIIVTVIFIHQNKIESQNTLAQEVNEFFQQHSLSDKLVIIIPEYLDKEHIKYFTEAKDKTFERLPGRSEQYFADNLLIYKFQIDGELNILEGKELKNKADFKKQLFRNGTTQIFQKNGGLVESSSDHHFVFPSKKHCSKFIRTGNVLIKNSEIFFIVLQLLKHFENRKVIYCDTSSINVLPYMVFELLRRFNREFDCPAVHSFESYEVFEATTERFSPEALVLISASTSGNIIDRLINENLAEKSQIKVIYFLGPKKNFLHHKENIICNLTKDLNDFACGEDELDTFPSKDQCKLCKKYSRPIYIRSDVFLTIQPKVEKVLISIDNAPKDLSSFVEHYRGRSEEEIILKNYYKENDANSDYEIFIDTKKLFTKITEGKFNKFNTSLSRLIDKNIPANIKYLVYLPDEGSKVLADLIKSRIPNSLNVESLELIKGFEKKITATTGCVVVVASSIVTGKKLLHISRLMRGHEKMSIVYFVGVLRVANESYSKRLKSNLIRGKDISDTKPFVAVEEIYCSNEQKNTFWSLEKIFFEKMIGELDEINQVNLYNYINKRLDILRDNKKSTGLCKSVFLPKFDSEDLILRKSFAFWDFNYEENEVFQSEVYFTISSIISNLENQNIASKCSLQQGNYIRNILSPANFQRFNDGIIQASILRAGKPEHFAYDLDSDASLEMKIFLISLIEQYDTEHGEALMDFLLTMGLKRLRLKEDDYKEVLQIASRCPEELISDFAKEILKNA